MVAPCPLVAVSGPPMERGRSHGRQTADRIAKGVSHYAAQLQGLGLGWDEVGALIHDHLPVHIRARRFVGSGAVRSRGLSGMTKDGRRMPTNSATSPQSFVIPEGTRERAAPEPTRCSEMCECSRVIHGARLHAVHLRMTGYLLRRLAMTIPTPPPGAARGPRASPSTDLTRMPENAA